MIEEKQKLKMEAQLKLQAEATERFERFQGKLAIDNDPKRNNKLNEI